MSKLTTIPFHDDTLFAIEEGGAVYVAVRPICDGLGISADRQRDRIRRDTILSEGATMMGVPSAGGEQASFCLRLDLLQGWLFGIDASRVKPEARDRVLAYQRECFAALHGHFYGRRAEGEAMMVPPLAAREEPVPVRRALVTEARQTFGARAAGSLWFALGLPVVPEMREGGPQGSFGFTYTAVPTAPAAR